MTARTPPPAAWIDPWPDGRVHPDAPAAAVWVAAVVTQLEQAQASASHIAAVTGLDARTVRSVLEGRRWPTLHTAAALLAYAGPTTSGGAAPSPFE